MNAASIARNIPVALLLGFGIGVVPTSIATAANQEESFVKVQSEAWGSTPTGHMITRFTLTNAHGNTVGLTDWGATLLQVEVPDREGVRANVNLGFDSLEGYLQRHPHFGGTIGRFANRIAQGRFVLNDRQYQLATNNGTNHLHGGKVSYDHRIWQPEVVSAEDLPEGTLGVRFRLVDPDGYEGYPGTVHVETLYTWNDANELQIAFTASSDAPTHVNLTNHSYWNLAGVDSGSAMSHVATIYADQWLEVDKTQIPTGRIVDVSGTPLDFRQPQPFSARLNLLPETKGYDHCYVIRGEPGTLRPAARVIDRQSGRVLDVETTQPGMQLYTGNNLKGNEASGGYGPHTAFCLETQHYPDTPNHPDFPSTLLKPGQSLHEVTIHRFSVE